MFVTGILLVGKHETNGEWLDHCKTLKVKDKNKKVIGRIINLTPKKEGLFVEIEIFNKTIYDKFNLNGELEFISLCSNPHFRAFI